MFKSITKKMVWLFCGLAFLALPAVQAQAGEARGTDSEPDHYLIGKGDLLHIVVWEEETLSLDLTVRVDGRISMPLVDDVLAAGRTPVELKEVLTLELKQYIEAPEVAVIVREQVSQSYYVLGETEENGEYPLRKDLTVLQAISSAGGFTEWADKRNLLLVRKAYNGVDERISINYNDIVSGKSPEQNVRLQAGDTLVVPY